MINIKVVKLYRILSKSMYMMKIIRIVQWIGHLCWNLFKRMEFSRQFRVFGFQLTTVIISHQIVRVFYLVFLVKTAGWRSYNHRSSAQVTVSRVGCWLVRLRRVSKSTAFSRWLLWHFNGWCSVKSLSPIDCLKKKTEMKNYYKCLSNK